VPGWVAVFRQWNHPGSEPGTEAYSAWAHPLWLSWNEYPAQAGKVNRHIAWYTSPYLWSHGVCWCLAVGLASGDQRRRTGSSSTLEALRDNALYKATFTLLFCFAVFAVVLLEFPLTLSWKISVPLLSQVQRRTFFKTLYHSRTAGRASSSSPVCLLCWMYKQCFNSCLDNVLAKSYECIKMYRQSYNDSQIDYNDAYVVIIHAKIINGQLFCCFRFLHAVYKSIDIISVHQ